MILYYSGRCECCYLFLGCAELNFLKNMIYQKRNIVFSLYVQLHLSAFPNKPIGEFDGDDGHYSTHVRYLQKQWGY